MQTLTQALWRICGTLDESGGATGAGDTTVLPAVRLELAVGARDAGVAGGVQETARLTGRWKHPAVVSSSAESKLKNFFFSSKLTLCLG